MIFPDKWVRTYIHTYICTHKYIHTKGSLAAPVASKMYLPTSVHTYETEHMYSTLHTYICRTYTDPLSGVVQSTIQSTIVTGCRVTITFG